MARIRTIKPGFFRSRDIAPLPLTTRLTFIGLWTYVDDAGRGDDDARLVKGDLWQLDDKHTVKRVENDLELLADAGLIERYEVDGRLFLRVVSWKEHQRINRPSPSNIPPSFTERSVSQRGGLMERSQQEGKGREEERKGKEVAPPEAGSDDWSESDSHDEEPAEGGSSVPENGLALVRELRSQAQRLAAGGNA